MRRFDFIVSNPPFKLDFPEYRDTLASDTIRFWEGVPFAESHRLEDEIMKQLGSLSFNRNVGKE
nr:hypothetical protein [Prevotella sp.]